MGSDLAGKWLELLKTLQPTIRQVAVLWNPPQPGHRRLLKALESAAVSLGIHVLPEGVRTSEDLPTAMLGSLVHFKALRQIADFAQQVKIPAVAWTNAFAQAGGLISYGVGEGHQWRRAAAYVDRIMKGAKPADIPVDQPNKFQLVINMKTAKAIGLTIPPSVLARADLSTCA
jgi:putative ABC transport system substrate-binding protein